MLSVVVPNVANNLFMLSVIMLNVANNPFVLIVVAPLGLLERSSLQSPGSIGGLQRPVF